MSASEMNRHAQQVLNMLSMSENKIQAIRSLLCEDHAHNIPPRVLSINWFTSKRCNYDCSYCSPHIHDAVSPFLDIEKSLGFVDNVHAFAVKHSKQVRWIFTGGECFLDPNFETLAQQIRSKSTTYHTNVTTNGSLPLSQYLKTATLFNSITFSLHFERPDSEIEKIVDTIIAVSQSNLTQVWVNAMYLPGSKKKFLSVIDRLHQSDVNYGIRKITPPKLDFQMPFVKVGPGRKDIKLLDQSQQSSLLEQWKNSNNNERETNLQQYYSQEDVDFLNECNHDMRQNMGIWTDQGYQELHSEQLVSKDLNCFQDWVCWAGVDNISIDHYGTIYRAQCFNDGPIGHISDGITFVDQPTVCKTKWCLCTTDIPIRKYHDPAHRSLIDP